MDGSMSRFQGLSPNSARSILAPLSSDQFLYSLSKTPSPARFQRKSCNLQRSTTTSHYFQDSGVGCNTTASHADVKGESCSGLKWGANSIAHVQRVASGAEITSTLHVTRSPTPTNSRSTNEELNKTSVESSAFAISTTVTATALSIPSVPVEEFLASTEGEVPYIPADKSRYHYNYPQAQESIDRHIGANTPLSESNETVFAVAHTTGLSSADLHDQTRQFSLSQQYRSFTVNTAPGIAIGQVLLSPLKKRLKWPSRRDPQQISRDVICSDLQRERAKTLLERQARSALADSELMLQNGTELEESRFNISPTIETQHPVSSSHLLNIHYKRLPESTSLGPPKRIKTKPSMSTISPHVNIKQFKATRQLSNPQDHTRLTPTRQDFCDGFVGKECRPTGRTIALPRPRRLPMPAILRRLMGYVCPLPLVRSRTFGVQTSLQEEDENSPSAPILHRLYQKNKPQQISDTDLFLTEEQHKLTKETPSLNCVTKLKLSNVLLSKDSVHYNERFFDHKESVVVFKR